MVVDFNWYKNLSQATQQCRLVPPENSAPRVYMQEVPSDQQPLYAQMVCRSSAIIPQIAPPGNKSLYSINGKHVYAKKYERHNKREKKRRGSTSQAKNT